jgi:hypothetical protein
MHFPILNLADVSHEDAHSEIVGFKKGLEEEIGEPTDHFSYSHAVLNAQSNAQTSRITREARFKSAVLTMCGPVRQGYEPLTLKRIHAANNLEQ